jgi:hypothetical protein
MGKTEEQNAWRALSATGAPAAGLATVARISLEYPIH